MGNTVRRIFTHYQPHLDEIVAYWLLCEYGEKQFPGVGQATIVFDDADSTPPPGHDWFAIGIWGGRFDEHPSGKNGRKAGKCAATLVAEALRYNGRRVSELPEIKDLLAYVNNEDLKGSTNRWELANLVKLLNRAHHDDPQCVVDMTTEIITDIVQQGREFHVEAKAEMRKVQTIQLPFEKDGKPLKLAVAKTACGSVKSYAFSRFGGNNAAVIQQDPTTGQVQIFTNSFYGLALEDVVAAIRVAEIEANGQTCTLSDEVLANEGTLTEAPNWCFFLEGQMMLNGSRSAPGTPATKLTLEVITELFTKHAYPQR